MSKLNNQSPRIDVDDQHTSGQLVCGTVYAVAPDPSKPLLAAPSTLYCVRHRRKAGAQLFGFATAANGLEAKKSMQELPYRGAPSSQPYTAVYNPVSGQIAAAIYRDPVLALLRRTLRSYRGLDKARRTRLRLLRCIEALLNDCPYCSIPLRPGMALRSTVKAHDGGLSFSHGGPGRLVECLKCSLCGSSWARPYRPVKLELPSYPLDTAREFRELQETISPCRQAWRRWVSGQTDRSNETYVAFAAGWGAAHTRNGAEEDQPPGAQPPES